MFVNGSGQNEQSQQRTFHRCLLPSFGSFGQTVSEEKNLKKAANQKKELPSIDASYQTSDHLAKRFQRRRFLEINQSETRIACGGHVCKWIGTK
jgi:3-methyladenine DNA glycosylase Tag